MSPSSGSNGSDRPAGREGGGRKRPRRKRGRSDKSKSPPAGEGGGPDRKPRPGASDSAARATPPAGSQGRDAQSRPRGRKRRGRKKAATGSAAEVLAQKPETVDLQKSAEEPLSPKEVAALREHFRFLREHRKELRLKVNAAEDLLLNGVREPTHRGVCQHLLGKPRTGTTVASPQHRFNKLVSIYFVGLRVA